jgi:hypothetical protein
MKSKKQTLTVSELIGALVVAPTVLVLAYNYGLTEVIQNLGGPDGNVNIFEGALAVYAVTILGKLLGGSGL